MFYFVAGETNYWEKAYIFMDYNNTHKQVFKDKPYHIEQVMHNEKYPGYAMIIVNVPEEQEETFLEDMTRLKNKILLSGNKAYEQVADENLSIIKAGL